VKEYTLAAACGVVLAVLLEVAVLRTGMFRDRRYWVALAVVAGFQLLVNGVLTCPPIVSYDPRRILGPRVACAPVEDLGFGFSMVSTTLALWRRACFPASTPPPTKGSSRG
jgi:lycopene cyclase domain-containing protein